MGAAACGSDSSQSRLQRHIDRPDLGPGVRLQPRLQRPLLRYLLHRNCLWRSSQPVLSCQIEVFEHERTAGPSPEAFGTAGTNPVGEPGSASAGAGQASVVTTRVQHPIRFSCSESDIKCHRHFGAGSTLKQKGLVAGLLAVLGTASLATHTASLESVLNAGIAAVRLC